MNMIMTLIICSTIIWFIIDKLKWIWKGWKYANIITPAVAGILGAACVFSYQLDLLVVLGVSDAPKLVGQILTTLVIMTGARGIQTIISTLKEKKE